MRLTLVVGARPNFMKAAPILRALTQLDVATRLVHTGQHYDERMSDAFLRDLGIPTPDAALGVGSGSHARQTAEVLIRFEEDLCSVRPDLVVVVGDVNSTLAATLAAVKLHIPVAHVEAGLRSGDRMMPEEINRIVTDSIASLLFVTEQSGVDHLAAEGIASERVHLVGNTMIDSLLHFRDTARSRVPDDLPERYGLVTMHRPSNVDEPDVLAGILDAILEVSTDMPLYWPLHPRTQKQLQTFGLEQRVQEAAGLILQPPCGYLEFLGLMERAHLILTDSGGIQEEALVLRVPVVTMRDNTERPSTVTGGGNLLAGSDPAQILAAAQEMLTRDPADFVVPELWDGKTGERIAATMQRFLQTGAKL